MAQPRPTVSQSPRVLGKRATKAFVTLLLIAALAVSALAVWTVIRLQSDPEMLEQLQEVHEQSSDR